MAIIKAFKGYRPPESMAEKVASPPYDVINSKEASAMAQGNEMSFLRVIKSEIDLPEEENHYSDTVYQKARANFLEFVEKGFLVQDDENSIYLYRQIMGEHAQIGIVALSAVEDYFNDVIKKHEHTRPVKEQDRINNMKTTGIHAGPVFCTFKKEFDIDGWMEAQLAELDPEVSFMAEDGVHHTLWQVTDETAIQELIQLFKYKVPATYIADGHHRAASSAKVGKDLSEENPNHTGNEAYNYFLTVLFPDDQLDIIDYNRIVKDLNGMDASTFLGKLEGLFDVELLLEGDDIKPDFLHEFTMYLDKKWYRLNAKEHIYDDEDPIKTLDVTVLQDHVLNPLLNIDDPRTNDRIDFVGGIRGLKELEKRVDEDDYAVAFALYPVTIQQLIDISDAGMVMPPKSTWFEPKLRSGLVVHRFE